MSIGYCTNVHPGTSIEAIKRNLEQYATKVRSYLGGSKPLGVGLWLPFSAACDLVSTPGAIAEFRDWLANRSLKPYTLNGFPYENFHAPKVKHQVYLPTWWTTERLRYTRFLVQILDGLLPNGELGSISTLPLAWAAQVTPEQEASAARQLQVLSRELNELEIRTGRRIVIAIEPEPGCHLQRTSEVISFFERHLPEENTRRYLTVCHDICHSVVMQETQSTVLQELRGAGIQIGKLQISSAIIVDWLRHEGVDVRRSMLEQLRGFAEDRYLHQTGCLDAERRFRLVEDLPMLLSQGESVTDSRWCIHFHMPIHLREFGRLQTSQDDIVECLKVLEKSDRSFWTGHAEVETYAWNVLPPELRAADLAAGIAEELSWVHRILASQVI